MAEESPQERAEKARVRRRWLNLGEVLAVLTFAVAALSFWNSYRERTNSEAEHASENAQSARKAGTLVLRSTPDKDGKTLMLAARAEEQAIQSQTIRFPDSLGLSPAETSGDARIERGWFDRALVKARRDAAKSDVVGDARLPVMIETHFLADGDPHVDRAVYEIGYATDHSFLGGTNVRLRGLSRVESVANAAAGQRTIDALWKALLPPKP
jgi:hypothetical protein